jgi:hypothetical protein
LAGAAALILVGVIPSEAQRSREISGCLKNEFKIRDVSTPLDMTKRDMEDWQVTEKMTKSRMIK